MLGPCHLSNGRKLRLLHRGVAETAIGPVRNWPYSEQFAAANDSSNTVPKPGNCRDTGLGRFVIPLQPRLG
jgi:hypothetical protein